MKTDGRSSSARRLRWPVDGENLFRSTVRELPPPLKKKSQTHCAEIQAVLDLLHFAPPLPDHLLELFHGLLNLGLIQMNRCHRTDLVFSGFLYFSVFSLSALPS